MNMYPSYTLKKEKVCLKVGL